VSEGRERERKAMGTLLVTPTVALMATIGVCSIVIPTTITMNERNIFYNVYSKKDGCFFPRPR
jgi:hypothetical protein